METMHPEGNIIVAGIGGVGGYFGGLLANTFSKHDKVKVHFMARGAHLEAIRESGLKVIKGNTTLLAYPASASDHPVHFGKADYVLLCCKSYDLEAVVESLRPCITASTVILPLLNGVDSRERIECLLPECCVLDGCVYIVSMLRGPGVVENAGNIQSLYFGADNINDPRLANLLAIFLQAGIEAQCSASIQQQIWEKFVFISPVATATSYFDCDISGLMVDEERKELTMRLMAEILQVAAGKGIVLPTDITSKTTGRMNAIGPGTTSSMHRDFMAGKHTELESLTGYVVRTAMKLGLDIPVYKRMYEILKKKQ